VVPAARAASRLCRVDCDGALRRVADTHTSCGLDASVIQKDVSNVHTYSLVLWLSEIFSYTVAFLPNYNYITSDNTQNSNMFLFGGIGMNI